MQIIGIDEVNINTLAKDLKQGAIAVIPTDTIYGIVCSAKKPKVIEKLYKIRRRGPDKKSIIIISSLGDLKLFKIRLNSILKKFLKRVWPGSVSVVLACEDKEFSYLHHDTKTLAFRLPKNKFLISVLKKSGPLIAPSANLSFYKPAETVQEAFEYFTNNVDYYINAGRLTGPPSTLIEIKDGKYRILREGAVKIK